MFGAQTLPDFWMGGEKRHGALDLRSPDKAQSAFRPWQLTRIDQMRQHARGFKNGDASAAVIVRSRTLVIEMAAVDNFSRSRIGARNSGGHDRPVAGADGGFHVGIQSDRFAASQAGPQCFGGLARDHEGEAGRLTRIQMTPANHGRIQAGPCRGLVWHVADDAGRAMLRDRQFLHSCQNAIGQHDLAAHVFARVIGLARAVADVDQFRFHVGAVTVVGEMDRDRSSNLRAEDVADELPTAAPLRPSMPR